MSVQPEPQLWTKFFVELLGLPPGPKGMKVVCPKCNCHHAWFKIIEDGGFIFRCPRKICSYRTAVGYFPAYKRPPGEQVRELYALLGGDPVNMDEYRFKPWWDSMVESMEWYREQTAKREAKLTTPSADASPEAPQLKNED